MEVHYYSGNKMKSQVLANLFALDRCVPIIYTESLEPSNIHGTHIISPKNTNEAELLNYIILELHKQDKQCAVVYTDKLRSDNSVLILSLLAKYEDYYGVLIIMTKEDEYE